MIHFADAGFVVCSIVDSDDSLEVDCKVSVVVGTRDHFNGTQM
jgi:hypothetical protein